MTILYGKEAFSFTRIFAIALEGSKSRPRRIVVSASAKAVTGPIPESKSVEKISRFSSSSFKPKLLHPRISIFFHRFNAFKPQDDVRSCRREVKRVVFREMSIVQKCCEKLSKS